MKRRVVTGAMINMAGSISINLGTNLMKLSHKMKNGELSGEATGQRCSKDGSPSDVETAKAITSNSGNGTATHPAQHGRREASSLNKPKFSSKLAKRLRSSEVEMTSFNAPVPLGSETDPASEPEPEPEQWTSAVSGNGRPRGRRDTNKIFPVEGDEEERVGLTEKSSVDSPSSAGGVSSHSSDDRTGLLEKKIVRSLPPRRDSSSRSSSKGGRGKQEVFKGNRGRVKELTVDEEFGDLPGVRRKACSTSPRQGLLTNVELDRGEGEEEEGEAWGEELEIGEGSEWKTKALWYLGAMLLVIGSLVNFVSFAFAPQSLLASLGSVQFVSNVIFGKVILLEVVTKRIIFGTATIVLGNTLTLCFSPHQETNFNTHQLKAFYDMDYNSLLFFELVVALVMHATYKSLKSSHDQGKPKKYSELAMPLAYAICSAIIGTQSVIQAKCLSELMMTSREDNQMGSPFTYLVIAIWFSTTVFWLTRMNRALAMFHGLFIIPALQVFWTFFSVVGGGFYFEEFNSLSLPKALGFAMGVFVVFLGVYLLAPRTHTDHGKRVGGAGEGDGIEMEGEESDLRKMLRLEVESPAASTPYCRTKPTHRRKQSLEAGDEEIDWDHTRMLSLGFFPSISTDQDIGHLVDPLEAVEAKRVIARLAGKLRQEDSHSDPRISQKGRERMVAPRPKDTPPLPPSSPGRAPSPGSASDEANGDSRDIEGGAREPREDKGHPRRRGR